MVFHGSYGYLLNLSNVPWESWLFFLFLSPLFSLRFLPGCQGAKRMSNRHCRWDDHHVYPIIKKVSLSWGSIPASTYAKSLYAFQYNPLRIYTQSAFAAPLYRRHPNTTIETLMMLRLFSLSTGYSKSWQIINILVRHWHPLEILEKRVLF